MSEIKEFLEWWHIILLAIVFAVLVITAVLAVKEKK